MEDEQQLDSEMASRSEDAEENVSHAEEEVSSVSSPGLSIASADLEEDLLSDEDDIDDAQQNARLEALEAAVSQNLYNYQAHVEYITALRKCGLLEKLRSAREAMSALFPLSPTMWQEWTQDEARLISGVEDVAAVEQLYERGVQEYLSVSLWSQFLEFKQQHDVAVAQYTSDGLAKMRDLFERALTATGLHLAEGGKIWTAYRQFEVAVVFNNAGAMEEVKAKQIDCIRNLFRRQLSVPLSHSAKTLKDYKEWECQQGNQIGDETDQLSGIPSHVASAYRKAVQMCSEREPYEEKVATGKPTDAELLQNFLSYIALEEGTGDPARAQVLYERAVAEFSVTPDLWLKYTEYLEKNLKVSSIIKAVYARAVRNCAWVQILWNRYLLALERSNAYESDISAVFEQSLHSGFGFSTPQEYLEQFLTRADGLRRRISLLTDGVEKQSFLANLRETFDRAAQLLSTYFPDFLDRSLRLHSYWAQLEACLANDVIAARGVWENLIKASGWMVEVWKGYIAMELNLGNVNEVRSIYKRCYSRKLEGNGTEVMCDAWLRFEREHGSLEDYDRALLKVVPRLAEVKQLQQQQDAKAASTSVRDLLEAKQAKSAAGKRARKKDLSASVTNKQANTAETLKKKKRGFDEVGSYPEKKSNKKAKAAVSEAADGQGDGHAEARIGEGMESTAADRATAPVEAEEEQVQTKPKKSGPTKQSVYTDECTAFVSNLVFEVTEENLREFFSSCGGVKEVRLLRSRDTGRSRGLAYVDFEDEQSLAAAISKNKQKLQGRLLSVARSDPASSRKKGAAGGGRGHGLGSFDQNSTAKEGETAEDRSHGDSRRDRGMGGRVEPVSAQHRRGGHVQLSGRNTFALPRAVARPLGFRGRESTDAAEEETPKSNDEFRQMLLK